MCLKQGGMISYAQSFKYIPINLYLLSLLSLSLHKDVVSASVMNKD